MAQPIDIDEFENDPAGLRKAIKALQAERDALAERIATQESETRASEIDRRFKEAGIPETAKSLIKDDTDLDSWFDVMGAVLGNKPAEEKPAAEAKPSQEPTAEEQRAKDVLETATPPSGAGTAAERLRAAQTPEEQQAILREGIAAINAAHNQQ